MGPMPGSAISAWRLAKHYATDAPYRRRPDGPTPAATALMGCIGNSVGTFESRGFNGLIDELMFFDRALSESEVKNIYSVQR